ncbi:hypothetical protein LCGC14_2303940 [marine sediment metagenome]|uniref:Uncharacterized protein n=1 Tax=marine sediment metagenome TaxID=412755 RepID=A0A0F9CML8_9ZZZZ
MSSRATLWHLPDKSIVLSETARFSAQLAGSLRASIRPPSERYRNWIVDVHAARQLSNYPIGVYIELYVRYVLTLIC